MFGFRVNVNIFIVQIECKFSQRTSSRYKRCLTCFFKDGLVLSNQSLYDREVRQVKIKIVFMTSKFHTFYEYMFIYQLIDILPIH